MQMVPNADRPSSRLQEWAKGKDIDDADEAKLAGFREMSAAFRDSGAEVYR